MSREDGLLGVARKEFLGAEMNYNTRKQGLKLKKSKMKNYKSGKYFQKWKEMLLESLDSDSMVDFVVAFI